MVHFWTKVEQWNVCGPSSLTAPKHHEIDKSLTVLVPVFPDNGLARQAKVAKGQSAVPGSVL